MEDREKLREVRKQMISQMEQKLHESWSSEEDSIFYYHRSEDRMVLSHALFWVMTQPQCLKGKIRKERFFSCFDSIKKRCLTLIFRIPKISQRCYIIAMSCMRLCL